MVDRLIELLESEAGYYDVEFDYQEEDSYHFEGHSDAFVQIRVDVRDNVAYVYDAYIGDKHPAYLGEYTL